MGLGAQPKRFLDCHLRRFRGPNAVGVALAPVDADVGARVSISDENTAAWASSADADVPFSRPNVDKRENWHENKLPSV